MKSNSGRSALLTMSLICIFLLAACGSSTPVLRYITISPSGSTISTGTTLQYTATGYYSNGAITPGITVSWSSSNTTVASINGTTGVAAGLTAGTTTITATALGITSSTTTLTVAGLTSIAVTPATTTISVAATQQYDAVATYTTSTGTTGTEDVTAQATWTSSSPAVATFSASTPGLATGVAPGTTTVTAAIGSVSGTATLNVTAATSLQVTPATATINVGGTVALTVMEVLANGTTQPPSSTVTWSSGTTSQANVVANGASGAIVAGFGASGASPVVITATEGALSASTNITVVTGSTHYAYVANSASNSISSYTVTAGTAPYLAPLATTNQNITAFTFLNPDGLYLYEIDQTSNIWVYNVTASSGVITQATGITQPQLAGQQGDNFGAVDPYGRFVYVVDDGVASTTYPQGTLYGFTVNPTTGALTPIAAVTAYTTNLNVPQSIVIDHTGSFLYVTNYGNGTTAGTVSAYSIDQTTGNLTPLSTPTYATGIGPEYATIDPTGTYLYVPNSGDTPNTVSLFSIGAGGALSPLASPTRTITGATDVINVAVSPNGSYLYVLDGGSNQVFGYTLAAGVPSTTPITGTPIATGSLPTGMAIDPTSSLLAVDNLGTTTSPSTISLFTIGSTGALTSQTPVATQDSPKFIVFYNEQP